MPSFSVSIDTEEDNWGSFSWEGATVENIHLLPRLQEVFDRWGARPTYLVNHAPLVDRDSSRVLGTLAERPDVEIGVHCHPWNTPPQTPPGEENSMMFRFSEQINADKIAVVTDLIRERLRVEPTTFRAGRWGFGPTVARGLAANGFSIDSSVSPLIRWDVEDGADFRDYPLLPYRFHPDRPEVPVDDGPMVQLPTTIGFLRGDPVKRGRLRNGLSESPLARLKVVGVLDRLGVLARRWLSPETTSAADMVSLVDACVRAGHPFMQMTFHSCTLLPGATPFVQSEQDQADFLSAIDNVLEYVAEKGYRFSTLGEVGAAL